jgi:hypothetical protein
VEGRSSEPGPFPFRKAHVLLDVDGLVPGGDLLQFYESGYTEHITPDNDGLAYGDWITIPVTPGPHRVGIRYLADSGTTGFVRARALWVRPVL